MIYSIIYLLETFLGYLTTINNGLLFSVFVTLSLAIISTVSIYKNDLFKKESDQAITKKKLASHFVAGFLGGVINEEKEKQT